MLSMYSQEEAMTSALASSVQHCTECANQCSETGKRNSEPRQ